MSTTTIRNILGTRKVHSVSPETPIQEAARLMAELNVGALAVLDGATLKGILSERDIVFRVVAQGLSLADTPVSTAMTADPVTIDIDDAVSEALIVRLGESFRHLPVLETGRVAGLLSYRDIPAEYAMLYERFREMSGARADQK
ncbi:Hypoxic response protein 1 [Thalassovita gelatinovora]|uniref:Hypoxic response protein 1 n=1 Tax=Thalassovita gelatinovora TaxID=53501 RepID=A0A0P1FCM9_THAGE|nr:CBS domain-containing protein [Thalassovita gelatinovora]QIZ80513.1 CBS domain-containing protein [Thalassovita gelatinovora]CUH65971.1 Hypoxic response protein 1 [Thalassovita gelatinovora]SEQ74724.1 CBS domain-containing protein [Thalassovita gelatinovora]